MFARWSGAPCALALLAFGLLAPILRCGAALPDFDYAGVAVDPAATEWPEDKDLISPFVIEAAKYFDEPLGRYYLYCGPHDHKPGNGIGLYYADSLDGPWTLHGPVVGDKMSSVSVIWNEEKRLLYLFAHLPPHSRNFFYTSADGIHFSEKTNAGIASHGYGKAYRHTLPGHGNRYIFIGWNGGVFGKWQRATPQRFMSGLWKSDDLEHWELVDHFRFKPPGEGHTNCGSPFYFPYQGKHYMLFHGHRPGYPHTPPFDGEEIWGYEVDASLRPVRYLGAVMPFEEGDPADAVRADNPFVIEGDDGRLHLFFSGGERLRQKIGHAVADPRAPVERPNFVVFLTDDQGYGDLASFGAGDLRTPHFDRLAEAGVRLTSHYVGAPVCGPSRAALMTGSYPIRIAEPGNRKRPHTVPHRKELMLPEVLKQAGYASALIGKWHLGESPRAQGFDYFYGTPKFNGHTRYIEESKFRTPILRNETVVVEAVGQAEMDQLTTRYTEEALRFMEVNRDRPFFLLLAHNMPHVPLGVSDKFRGRSGRGLYGDVIEELDWSLGRVTAKLDELGLAEDTLVVFLSDNGPWIADRIGEDGGSAGPLRGSKLKSWEGGPRVPCIVRWPGRIPAGGESDAITTAMDFLPTFARLAGVDLPADLEIDGRDLFPLLSGETEEGPHEAFLFYLHTHLQAVRSGPWKLVLPRPASPPWLVNWWAAYVDAVEAPELYDLRADIGERRDLASEHPERVEALMERVEAAREELGDYDRTGSGARFFDPGRRRPAVAKQQGGAD